MSTKEYQPEKIKFPFFKIISLIPLRLTTQNDNEWKELFDIKLTEYFDDLRVVDKKLIGLHVDYMQFFELYEGIIQPENQLEQELSLDIADGKTNMLCVLWYHD